MKKKEVFLSAHWEWLAMFNYEIPEEVLLPYLPKGTVLDLWEGKAYVSVVGFLFNNTKVFGIQWPWHKNFEEVNLRVYIKYFDGKEWQRGVSFISEIVPKPLITFTANLWYNEHYKTMPMRHWIEITAEKIKITYNWKNNNNWNSIKVIAENKALPIAEQSAEEFILEHYWGFNQHNQNTLIRYQVVHERWQVYKVSHSSLDCAIASLYGNDFVPFLSKEPASVFLAKGSAVEVNKPDFIRLAKQ